MSTQIAGSAAPAGVTPRRYELDWLRTIVVLGIIPYHALVIFGASSAIYIKSAQANPALGLIGSFVLSWGIPLIFLLSGAATRLALQRRSLGAYVGERVGRLLVPSALVVLVFAPLQAFLILLSNPGLISMSPIPIQNADQLRDVGTFYGTYLNLLVTTVRGYSPSIGSLAFAHVWFIPRLLVVSVLSAALIVGMRRFGRHLPAWVVNYDRHPVTLLFGGGLVTALVVALIQPGWLDRLTAHWPYTDVWADFILDFALFWCGYLIYDRGRLRTAVHDLRLVSLALGLVCWLAVGGVMFTGNMPPASFAPASLLFAVATALSAWLLSLAMLGLAMRYLTFTTRLQRYCTYAAFPVYLLHMPVLTVAAFYLLKLPLPWYVQLLMIIAATVLVAFGLFEYVIRRTPVTRFLFGIRKWTSEDGRQAPPSPTPSAPDVTSAQPVPARTEVPLARK